MLRTVRDVCKFIGTQLQDAVCIETGSMYTCLPGNEVHTTTNNIYEFVVWEHGIFYSLDIDPEHIEFARKYCYAVGERLFGDRVWTADVHFLEGDSVDSLKRLRAQWSGGSIRGNSIDLLCLDSKEFDEDHMVNEYLAIAPSLCLDKHFVLVDDIHNQNSVKYKKTVPLLKQLGYSYIEVPTPTGLFLATKGYNLPCG